MIAGIDFGSRTSGKTVIAYLNGNGKARLMRAGKGEDADAFLERCMEDLQVSHVGIDAPLSLPGIYSGLASARDYHYRDCDRELKAMSPMFLGGLSARAIAIREKLEKKHIKVIETYPSKTAELLPLDPGRYKKDRSYLREAAEKVTRKGHFEREDGDSLPDWHEVDALLALFSTLRYREGQANYYGRADEGLIVV